MAHCGIADLHLREAKIAVAPTTEEQAALRSQAPWHYSWVRILGHTFILIVCGFKIASLIETGALFLLGG